MCGPSRPGAARENQIVIENVQVVTLVSRVVHAICVYGIVPLLKLAMCKNVSVPLAQA